MTGRLQAPANNPKIDWKQILVQIEPFLPELPTQRLPEIPAEIAGDKKRIAEWHKEWLETEPGKAYTELKKAHDAQQGLRNAKLYFRATLNNQGEFRFDDVPEGEYILKDLFGRSGHRFSVPPMPGGRSNEALDLGLLALELRKN